MRLISSIQLVAAFAIFLIYQSQAAIYLSTDKTSFREMEKDILDDILEGQYDRRIRPAGANGSDGATLVNINVMFRGISDISDNKMEYSVILTFREEWLDDRLKYDSMAGKIKYLTLNDPSKVWMPDLFFSNEREGHKHNIIVPNVYVRISPNGSILYSIRLSLTLSCPMNLKLFPLDHQTCSLLMVTYGWTTKDLVFLWSRDKPVQVNENLKLPRFTLEQYTIGECNSNTTTGIYSCLQVDLLFRREFSYYLITIYIPCCMLVIVSWVSFWLDANAVPARVSLGVTTLLTMATQTTGINNSLPPVSYTKAIDVWTGVCLTFVFTALLEFALVNYASRSDAHRDKMKKQQHRQWEQHHEQQQQQQQIVDSQQQQQQQQQEQQQRPAADDQVNDRNSFAMRPLVAMGTEVIFMEESSRPRGRPRRLRSELQLHPHGRSSSRCCRSTWIGGYSLRSKRIDVIARIIFPMIFAIFNLAYWTSYLSAGHQK